MKRLVLPLMLVGALTFAATAQAQYRRPALRAGARVAARAALGAPYYRGYGYRPYGYGYGYRSYYGRPYYGGYYGRPYWGYGGYGYRPYYSYGPRVGVRVY